MSTGIEDSLGKIDSFVNTSKGSELVLTSEHRELGVFLNLIDQPQFINFVNIVATEINRSAEWVWNVFVICRNGQISRALFTKSEMEEILVVARKEFTSAVV